MDGSPEERRTQTRTRAIDRLIRDRWRVARDLDSRTQLRTIVDGDSEFLADCDVHNGPWHSGQRAKLALGTGAVVCTVHGLCARSHWSSDSPSIHCIQWRRPYPSNDVTEICTHHNSLFTTQSVPSQDYE